MAGRGYPKVHSVTLKPKRTIVVEIDRYMFVFRGQPSDTDLVCVAARIFGKRDPNIDPEDYVAKSALIVAEEKALSELRLWAEQNPTVDLERVQEQIIWLDPARAPLTQEQRAANRQAIDQLIVSSSAPPPPWPGPRKPPP